MALSFATSHGDKSAAGIGWINFQNMAPGDTVNYSGKLTGGYDVSFTMALAQTAGDNLNFNAVEPESVLNGDFGTGYYNGIKDPVVLYSDPAKAASTSTFQLTDIAVTNKGNPIDFTLVFADAESTNLGETVIVTTDGSAWQLFNTIGTQRSINNPTVTPATFNNATVSFAGTLAEGPVNEYILTTNTPENVTIVETMSETAQGFAIGFAVTSVTLRTNIIQRIDAADQFVLTIAGDKTATATTTGTNNRIQAANASVILTPGDKITLTETMAAGSASALTDYVQRVSAYNIMEGGAIPPTGTIPITDFTPELGDLIMFIITNSDQPTITKSASPESANRGDTITYTIVYENTTGAELTGVTFTDIDSDGLSYVQGSLMSNVGISGTPSNASLGAIPQGGRAVISWEEKVYSTSPVVFNTVDSAAFFINGVYAGTTNQVAVNVNYADIKISDIVTPSFASIGDTITYTLNLKNIGNTPATSIILTHTIPQGTTYVPSSLTSSIPSTGDPLTQIIIPGPLPAGETATVSFQVVINEIPRVNPIQNSASAIYTYVSDPTAEIPESGAAQSRTNFVNVWQPIITVTKRNNICAAHIGDKLTYNIVVANTGNTAANNVILYDLIPFGTTLFGTPTVSVPFTGNLATGLRLGTIAPDAQVLISFTITVGPNTIANPICNKARVTYNYYYGEGARYGRNGSAESEPVCTTILQNDYEDQVTCLIQSVALEEAALAAIADKEGAKIQKMVNLNTVSPQELITLNNSVNAMTESIALLQAILNQKLSIVQCQIGNCGKG